MLVNGTHVRRLDLDGKAAAEPPFAAEMRDHTFLQPHTTPQNVGGPHLFEGQSASGTADDPSLDFRCIYVLARRRWSPRCTPAKERRRRGPRSI